MLPSIIREHDCISAFAGMTKVATTDCTRDGVYEEI